MSKTMLEGKKALITGASRGIGKAIALSFAENGAYVGINYKKSDKKAQGILNLIKKKCGDGVLLKGDVSNPDDVKKFVKKFADKTKNIDILVNNAGVYYRNSFEKIKQKTWDEVVSTNLSGCFYVTKEVIPFMKSGSRIIFVSSQMAFKGSPHGSDYAATKAGMLGLMRSLALELAAKKILVNAIAPGTIDTDIIKDYTKDMRQKRINEIPLKRLGEPEDIANACLFLASDMCSYITGETININGGLYIH
jgi:3-oxoacyl-[acyl-carrier protein] reductase